MASAQVHEKDDPLNVSNNSESWVTLPLDASSVDASGDAKPSVHSIYNGNMEKLLMEAQKEWSRSSSRNTSSRGSPKSPHSPTSESASSDFTTIQENDAVKEFKETTDWIWDWSSRMEAQPPSDWMRFKHPRKARLSVRNTSVMKSGPFCLENLPALMLTNLCSFLLGAAMMFFYLRKHSRWLVVTPID